VFVQNIMMLEVWKGILAWLEGATGTTNYAITFTITFVIAMAIPVALLAGAALVAGRLNGESLATNIARFGYAIIPLDVAGHVAHNLFHLFAEGKAVLFTALPLFGQISPGGSPALLSLGTLQAVQYLLIGLGLLGSLYAAYRIAKSHYGAGQSWPTFLPYATLVVILGIMNVGLFMLPMAMRM
jgi:hypothetical protein